ncbi:helix-turn-helix domain-containing protein [Pedobacter sp. GR22-6]|uniref:helix-turn-helix domain-containing protein n=1 Tax=Pedobacter sp. GR22-6 TaxID=3127957 RepID=UPI00307F5B91
MKVTDILNNVILFGAVQGFIMSALLFSSRTNRAAARYLGLLVFFIALASINLYGNYVNWFNLSAIQFIVQLTPLILIMPLGPLLYFYIRRVSRPDFSTAHGFKYHFYPVLIEFIPALTVASYIIATIFGWIARNPRPWVNFIEEFNVYVDVVRWLSLSFYTYLAYKYLSSQEDQAHFSKANVNWLRTLVYIFAAFEMLWLIYLIPYLIPRYRNELLELFGWYPIYIPLAVLIYWLGIKGYIHSQNQKLAKESSSDIKKTLGRTDLDALILSIEKKMQEDRAYLDAKLNLNSFAKMVDCAPKTVSAVINQHFGKNFNDFINDYRVREFKKRFAGKDSQHLTIAGVALECGFPSQATFQRVFKLSTGYAPSKFRDIETDQ